MRNNLFKITRVAGIVLALAFTLSCSSDDSGGGSNNGSRLPDDPCDEVLTPLPPPYCNEKETVTIGDQTWQKCNLNVAPSTGNHSCYCNKPENCEKYGRLYDWVTAMALPDSCTFSLCVSQIDEKHRGLCPSGYHIPSNEDWKELISYVDNLTLPDYLKDLGLPSSIEAGNYLKATKGWESYGDEGESGNGTDDFGFSALPGGISNYGAGQFGAWWSSTESSYIGGAYQQGMSYIGGITTLDIYTKQYMVSVRCLKD